MQYKSNWIQNNRHKFSVKVFDQDMMITPYLFYGTKHVINGSDSAECCFGARSDAQQLEGQRRCGRFHGYLQPLSLPIRGYGSRQMFMTLNCVFYGS